MLNNHIRTEIQYSSVAANTPEFNAGARIAQAVIENHIRKLMLKSISEGDTKTTEALRTLLQN